MAEKHDKSLERVSSLHVFLRGRTGGRGSAWGGRFWHSFWSAALDLLFINEGSL